MRTGAIAETDIPARLDRLPWGRFHTLVVAALGITWILDGLEVTLAGAVAGALRQSPVLQFSNTRRRLRRQCLPGRRGAWRCLLRLADRPAGAQEALFHHAGRLSRLPPRRRPSPGICGALPCSAFSPGAGIGGEYAAINSTIQELIPARVRGWTDLVINGSFWVGAAAGAAGSIVLLDPALLPVDIGWRAAFAIGAALEPRHPAHAHVAAREPALAHHAWPRRGGRGHRRRHRGALPPRGPRLGAGPFPKIRLRARSHTPLGEVAATLFQAQRQRTLVGLSLMAAQAFFYNAIFFTYALVLTDFYGVGAENVGWYILPFAAGNFLGPGVPGAAVRHRRPPADARLHLRHVRAAAGGHRLAVRAGPGLGGRADRVLDDHLLLCVRRRPARRI